MLAAFPELFAHQPTGCRFCRMFSTQANLQTQGNRGVRLRLCWSTLFFLLPSLSKTKIPLKKTPQTHFKWYTWRPLTLRTTHRCVSFSAVRIASTKDGLALWVARRCRQVPFVAGYAQWHYTRRHKEGMASDRRGRKRGDEWREGRWKGTEEARGHLANI